MRYVPNSAEFEWASPAQKILELIEETKSRKQSGGGDTFPLCYSQCRDLLSLAQDIESWEGKVFLDCQDVLSGPSFIWDLNKGPVPKTGSRSTVPHTVFKLGEEAGITERSVKAYLPQGEYCPYKGFSYTACHEVLSQAMAFLGSGWSHKICLKEAEYEWSINQLVLKASHKEVHQLILCLVAEGEGRLRPSDGYSSNLLKSASEGTVFVTVVDRDHRNRLRTGQALKDGGYWQYP